MFRVYRGWSTTQLYGDYFINHIRIPYETTQYFMESIRDPGRFFSWLPWLWFFQLGSWPPPMTHPWDERYIYRSMKSVFLPLKTNHSWIGKYTSPMDGMGPLTSHIRFSKINSLVVYMSILLWNVASFSASQCRLLEDIIIVIIYTPKIPKGVAYDLNIKGILATPPKATPRQEPLNQWLINP